MNLRGVVTAGSVLALTLFSIGCGSNSSNSSSAFTQAQALTATSDLFVAMAEAPLTGHVSTPVEVNAVANGIRNANLDGEQAVPSIAVANLLAASRAALPNTTLPTFTFNCPSGGTIVVNGSYTTTITGTTISSTRDIVETINNCSDGGFTMNSNPNVTIIGTDSISGNILTGVETMTGGFIVGSNSCSINVTMSSTFNTTTDAMSGTISGSICGISVNGSI
jgi:hypothetical protein